MRNFKFITQTTIAFMALCMPFLVHASARAVTTLPGEGNVQCSDYAANKVILSMDTSNPEPPTVPDTSIELTGPSYINVPNETVNYILSGDLSSLEFFGASVPIDYLVIKSSKIVKIFMYESGGVKSDYGVTLDGLEITAFSLCYGLDNDPVVVEEEPMPQCQTSEALGSLDGVGIECPSVGTSVVCNMEIDFESEVPELGLNNGSGSCCVCNLPEEPPVLEGALTTDTLNDGIIAPTYEYTIKPFGTCASYGGSGGCTNFTF